MGSSTSPRTQKGVLSDSEIAAIRDALRVSVNIYGLRHTARELKVSPTGLTNTLDGAQPNVRTTRILARWFDNWRAREVPLDEAGEIALDVLAATVPEDSRGFVCDQVRAVIYRHAYPTAAGGALTESAGWGVVSSSY